MIKIVIFILLLILAAVGMFAIENIDSIFIKIPFYGTYEISKVAFLILSSTIGAFFVLIIVFIRDSKRAIENLKLSKKQKKDEKVRQYFIKASNASLAQRTEVAKDNLNEILKIEPENIDAMLKLGDLAFENKDYNMSLDYYRRAYDLNRSNLYCLLSLAELYEKIGQYDDALRYLDEILSFDPENLMALYKKRSIFEKKHSWDILLSIQESIIRLQKKPDRKETENLIATGYAYENALAMFNKGEYEKAIKAFRGIQRMYSTFIPAYIGLADSLFKLGELQAAGNVLENAYAELGNLLLLIKNEDLYINTAETSRIIKAYKNGLLKNPDDYRLKFLLGRAYLRLNKYSESLAILESLDSIISNPEFHIFKAKLYLEQNRNSEALQEITKATVLDNFKLIYLCLKCGNNSNEWSGRCGRCNDWNTYSVNISGIVKS